MPSTLSQYLTQRQRLINEALNRYLPKGSAYPPSIHRAVRYSVMSSGKRIRPVLALAACEAVGGDPRRALAAACAIEMIHTYSLIHDDLPSIDNDDYRRGRPSCHKRFGEALAVLAGDALLTRSFELLAQANGHSAAVHLTAIREIAAAAGTSGMIGGQVVDIEPVRGRQTPQRLRYINAHKTGALIAVSVKTGALLGGATPLQYRRLSRFGERIGLVFQIVDDVLDGDGVAKLLGVARAGAQARRLTQQAVRELAPLGVRAERLRQLASLIATRTA